MSGISDMLFENNGGLSNIIVKEQKACPPKELENTFSYNYSPVDAYSSAVLNRLLRAKDKIFNGNPAKQKINNTPEGWLIRHYEEKGFVVHEYVSRNKQGPTEFGCGIRGAQSGNYMYGHFVFGNNNGYSAKNILLDMRAPDEVFVF